MRGWTNAIHELREGRAVTVHPRGKSMEPRIRDGQEVVLRPITDEVRRDDVVLAKVRGRVYLHLAKKVDARGRVMIGNNKGRLNGWAGPRDVYGRADV